MKIICDCGEVTNFINGEDGPYYTEGEGWYKRLDGSMDIAETHDQVNFRCENCGQDI